MNGEIGNAPVFVKINEYKTVATTLDAIRAKLADAKDNLGKISDIKAQEDSELREWESSLGEIDKKVEEINKALFEHPSA